MNHFRAIGSLFDAAVLILAPAGKPCEGTRPTNGLLGGCRPGAPRCALSSHNENCCVGRQREHDHGGEAGILQQLAEGKFEVVHIVDWRSVPQDVLVGHLMVVSQVNQDAARRWSRMQGVIKNLADFPSMPLDSPARNILGSDEGQGLDS